MLTVMYCRRRNRLKIRRYMMIEGSTYCGPTQQLMVGWKNMMSGKMTIPMMRKRVAVISQNTFMVFFSSPSAIRFPTPALMPSPRMLTRNMSLLIIMV